MGNGDASHHEQDNFVVFSNEDWNAFKAPNRVSSKKHVRDPNGPRLLLGQKLGNSKLPASEGEF